MLIVKMNGMVMAEGQTEDFKATTILLELLNPCHALSVVIASSFILFQKSKQAPCGLLVLANHEKLTRYLKLDLCSKSAPFKVISVPECV